MADEPKKLEAPKDAAAQRQRVGVRLVPGGQSDVPLFANVARVQRSAAAVIVDFGFLEPAPMQALARQARAGAKIPEAMDGRLVARIALSAEALASLHKQLDQAIKSRKAKQA